MAHQYKDTLRYTGTVFSLYFIVSLIVVVANYFVVKEADFICIMLVV